MGCDRAGWRSIWCGARVFISAVALTVTGGSLEARVQRIPKWSCPVELLESRTYHRWLLWGLCMRHGPEVTLSRFSRCTRAETGNAVTARYRCPFPETWFLVSRAASSAGRLPCTGRSLDNIRVVICMQVAKWLHTVIVKFKSKTSYPNNCAGLCRVRNAYACWTLMIPCL
jgi:hypothetical protein